ncbi:MAG: DUF58 domain-containing protein [Planctomycetota bacterium]|jgi:hypothetical protein
MSRTDGRLRIGLTDAGKTVLRGTVFVALAALIVPAFGVLSALISVVLMALLVGYVLRPRIQVSGNLPERVVAGRTAQLRYALKNVARMPAYNFSVRLDTLPESIEQLAGGHVVSRLGPGETTEVTVEIRPKRRGHYRIRQPVCRSGFPFNLFTFAAASDDEEVLIVLPVFSRLQIQTGRMSRHGRTGAARLVGVAGVFPEYAGSRPFVAGDSPRTIDARAWARLSVPATKEYHHDSDNHTALVLDTGVSDAALQAGLGEIRELEAAVSLCASVAFTINNDCLIDMLLAGPDLHLFDGWPRAVRLDKIHDILAGVEPHEGYCLEETSPMLADRFYEISEVVFVLMNWHKTYWQLLDKAHQAGCHSTVFVIDGSDGMNLDRDITNRAPNVRLLSPDDVLTGRIGRL